MDKFSEIFVNSSAIIAVCIGGGVLLLLYVLKLFKIEHAAEETNQSEQVASHLPKKESSSAKSKKKPTVERWTRDKSFSSPWLLKTLKNHTGQVLNIDYSSSGKYLASCGEEEPDPDPDLDMNTSSGSECNKDDSRPPSADPSPGTKGLSRRQRKNRRREDGSPELKKKLKNIETMKNNAQHLRPKAGINEANFVHYLHSHLLTPDQLFTFGYPIRALHNKNSAEFFHSRNGMLWSQTAAFDVYARGFVPSQRFYLEASSSSECSEGDSEESSGSEPDTGYYTVRDEGVQQQCARCGRGFFVTKSEYLTQERCNYHWGKLQPAQRGVVPVMMQYSCCKGKRGSIGCSTCKLHVWNGVKGGVNRPCDGFVYTRPKKGAAQNGNCGVYAVDCEMCYTVAGLELTKVTVVDMYGRLVYDSFVKPKNEIIDYNTRFSGVTAKDLKSSSVKSLKQVQNDLRGFINAGTILIGHGLENDLRALKMIHYTVVDTACSFPHIKGLPYKNSLKQLVATYLQRDIQCGSNGHNSYEDAIACMELMIYKVQNENRIVHR